MKNIIIVLMLLGMSLGLNAQRHELGLFGGMPNLISDIGDATYVQLIPDSVNPKFLPYSIGLVYRFNFNPMQGLRLNLGYNHVVFDDSKTREDYRTARDLNGDNDIIEASIVYEYAFFEINDEQKFMHSPYIFAGVGAFMYKDRLYNIEHQLNRDASGNTIAPTGPTDFQTNLYYDEEFKTDFAIPFSIGYRVKFNYNWVLSAEIGVRATTVERLDYSFADESQFSYSINDTELFEPQYAEEIAIRQSDIIQKRQTGNLKSVDWYVVSGLSLTYSFGRPPCFCN